MQDDWITYKLLALLHAFIILLVATSIAIYLGWSGVHNFVLFRGQDPQHCGLAGIVQAENEDAQFPARLFPQTAQQRKETLRAEETGALRLTRPLY